MYNKQLLRCLSAYSLTITSISDGKNAFRDDTIALLCLLNADYAVNPSCCRLVGSSQNNTRGLVVHFSSL